jgi:phage-related protein
VAVVGTAFIRLRVIGDRLAQDIGAKVKESVEQSAPQLAQAGESIGEKVGESTGEALSESVNQQMGRIADDIGERIGERMAENLGNTLRRRVGGHIRNGISGARGQVDRIGGLFKPAFDRFGKEWGEATGGGFRKILGRLIPAAIGLAITALPSMLAWTGAVAGAIGATLVPAIGAIGPVAAGAGLAYVAAMANMKIATGLIGIALKAETEALADFQKRSEEFKESIARPIQAGLLSGLNASMRIAGPLVDQMSPALTRFGIAAGNVPMRIADAFASSGDMSNRLIRILNTQTSAIDSVGRGATRFAQVLAILLDNLRPVTMMLANGVRDFGGWALGAIRAAEESGRLQQFIERMMNALSRAWRIARDFGIGLYNVFRAASPASQSMAAGLARVAARFREWTGDPANQDRMRVFFQRMYVITRNVASVMGDLARAAGRALEQTDVDSVLQGLRTLVSVGRSVGQIFEQIRENAGPQLAAAFSSFADVILQLAQSGVIGILAQAFANLFQIIGFVLAIPGVGALLSLVAGLAVMARTVGLVIAVVRPLIPIIKLLFTVIRILAVVFGGIPLAIAAVVGALIWFLTQTETGRAILAAIWEGIKTAISAAIDGVVAAFNWVVEAFQTAWTWISNIATQLWTFLSGIFQSIAGVVSTVWNGIVSVITTVVSAIWTAVSFYLNLLWAFWSRIFGILLLPVRIFYGVVILIWNAILAGIRIAVQAIWSVVTSVWNSIWGFIGPILQGIRTVIVNAWNTVYNFVAGILMRVYAFVMARFYAIRAIINGVMVAVRTGISNAWNAVYNAVSGALNRVWGVIRGVWNRVIGFIQGAMDRIKGIASGAWEILGNIGSGVMDGLKAAVNAVVDGINTVIGGINWAIDTANKLPGPDIPRIPTIPRLAQGGVVSPSQGGTLALVAEAGRAERVEPLDRSGLSRRDYAMIEALAGGQAGGGTTHVYIGTRELVEIVDVVVEERESDLGRRVLTGRKAG